MREPFSHLTYCGKPYELRELQELLWKARDPLKEEKQSLASFLEEWQNDASYIEVRTSGSTGTEKVIRLQKPEMLDSARQTIQYLDLNGPVKALLCLPVRYIAGKMMVIRAIAGGWDLIHVLPSANPLKSINRQIGFTAMTPLQITTVLKESPDKLRNLHTLILGGGPVSPSLEKNLAHTAPRIFATYGMTETITHVAMRELNGPRPTPYFKAMPRVRLSQDNRQCLVINATYLSGSPFHTNDLVELRDARSFRWIGRLDFMINSGGIKINPEKVESSLSAEIDMPFVISSVPHPDLGEKVVLVIEGQEREMDRIMEICENKLDRYEKPREILYFNTLPRTGSQKLDRKSINEMLKS